MKKGFTLIETLVAVTILTLAVAGPLVTASRAVTAAQIARDQLTASYLAQEGIEYVRMMRDNEYLAVYNQPNASSLAWTNFLAVASIGKCATSAIGVAPFCTLDAVGIVPVQACSGSCQALNLATAGAVSYYTQGAGQATPFTRTIQAVGAAPGEKIVSKVSWTFHSTPYSVTVTTNLTPWQ
jgi:prepilin-type N-terminal cleavage/methylation domain-containing protein